MERGHRENPKASQSGLGWTAGDGKQALRIGQFSPLKTSKVTAHSEEVNVESLQVLLPLLNLMARKKTKQCLHFDLCELLLWVMT